MHHMHESTHAFLQKKRQTLGLFRVGVRRSINVLGKRAGQASEPVRQASRSKFHLLYLQLLIIEAILEI
jgi:hypothetical protein